MILLAAGLGAFFATEILKTFWVWQIGRKTKILAALVASGTLVLLHVDDAADAVLYICGAGGLSVLTHRLHRFLGAVGDEKRLVVFAASKRR